MLPEGAGRRSISEERVFVGGWVHAVHVVVVDVDRWWQDPWYPGSRARVGSGGLGATRLKAPTPETARVLFELTAGVARPGSTVVPLEVYITSSHEFTSYSVSLTFPPNLVSVTRIDERISPGAVAIDNESGTLGADLQYRARRIGREEERVHIATVYASVSGSAVARSIVPGLPCERGVRSEPPALDSRRSTAGY